MNKTAEERAEQMAKEFYGDGEHLDFPDSQMFYLAGWNDRDKESGWISVKERLPEDGQTVIYRITVSTPNGKRWKLDYGEWDANEQTFFGEFFDHRDLGWDVSHWMPLPAAPKEEA